jgi:hypothetical protein
MIEDTKPHPVSEILDRLEAAGGDETVSVGDIVERMGARSFAPLLLVPALVMVSPISSIPGTPTLSATIIALIAAQMLIGRRTLWLPRLVRERRVSRVRMERAVAFLRRPVGWIEPRMRPRLVFLADGRGTYLALLVCLGITLVMPMMEFLPLLASVAAVAISLIAAGLLARDGVLVLAGYCVVIAGIVTAWTLIRGAQAL